MRFLVLGSAAGGGFPQWNCACDNCRGARSRTSGLSVPRFLARTQDSIAMALDDDRFLVVNASPDISAQIAATPALHPSEKRRSPIAGVVLTNGDLDHVLGLLSLRENTPFVLYATRRVRDALWQDNVFFRTLERFDGQVTFEPLEIDRPVSIGGLSIVAAAAPGKVPKHLEGRAEPSPEDNVALFVTDEATGALAVLATALGGFGDLVQRMAGAACVFADGTFWSEDELVRLGLGTATAQQMAHVPIGGRGGSLEALSRLRGRKIFTHVNNSNPILDAESDERRAVEAAGFEVAFDGMEVRV